MEAYLSTRGFPYDLPHGPGGCDDLPVGTYEQATTFSSRPFPSYMPPALYSLDLRMSVTMHPAGGTARGKRGEQTRQAEGELLELLWKDEGG